ncbi:hypothetical protein COCNU_scaffold001310G000010 [Cocos nucifera]|nr:hypothetical protein [Cocos nucifera]
MLEVVDQMIDLDPWQLIWGFLGTILKSDHQMLIHIKRAHRREVEAQKAQEDLRAEIDHLQERVDESPTNANPLPLGVSIKPLIKNLRKKVYLLRKKLKKM